MKALIMLSAIVVLSLQLGICLGQNAFERSNAKGKSTTYKITGSSNNYKKAIAVANGKNIINEKLKKNPPPHLTNIELISELKLNNIFLSALGTKRLEQLSTSDYSMLITFYVNDLGKILELEFILPETTIITPAELEILESMILKELSFKLNQNEMNGAKLFQLLKLQRYKDLL
ncbi:hypothetical protein [Rufibacter ruber]|uniref:hypothetical protein n=1 Tax=Rufibacter ruber TaxID=1783499 RepID=UPI000830368F|nr:hypothetical protein [Rufibacter ruber]